MLTHVRSARGLALVALAMLLASRHLQDPARFGDGERARPIVKAGAPKPPRASELFWIVSPRDPAQDRLTLEDGTRLPTDTSNNNLALRYHDGRLWFAFRSATHHHPKPPVWAPQYLSLRRAKTRLYVVSTPMSQEALARFPKGWSDLRWRLELEVVDAIRERVFRPKAKALLAGDTEARRWFETLYAPADVASLLADVDQVQERRGNGADPVEALLERSRRYLSDFDVREPLFFELNGRSFLYVQQIEGTSMRANSLRSWAFQWENGHWSDPRPVLVPNEHFWDIQVRKERGKDVAYMTSYRGAAYEYQSDDAKTLVRFRRSTDGLDWALVDGHDSVYTGGASEAAFAFEPSGDLFVSLRLEDGDRNGWGTLFATASKAHLGSWDFQKPIDPRRYDSPRVFVHDGHRYQIARQALCAGPDGPVDIARNCPYDRSFVNPAEEAAERSRDTLARRVSLNLLGRVVERLQSGEATRGNASEVFARGRATLERMQERTRDANEVARLAKGGFDARLSLLYQFTYYVSIPMRTTLYWWNAVEKAFEPELILPSAGDTSFPSYQWIDDDTMLLGNYSSPPEQGDLSWREGQENRTGIYFVKLTFPKGA